MGDIQGSGYDIERPVHDVTLDGFEISKYEITQGQYKSIIGLNPSHFSGSDDLPVEYVSWNDAVKFCNALSDTAGLDRCYDESTWECDFSKNGYRLPTEAEWEYACRAETTTEYSTGDSENDLARAGWFYANSGNESLFGRKWNYTEVTNNNCRTHPVGEKEPNAWGLYDMHGNVWEWCNDWYDSGYYASPQTADPVGSSSGSSRVYRGGSWGYSAWGCRSANRLRYLGAGPYDGIGFRVVRRQ